MGEIDRISPIVLQPLLGLHATERVQPESEKNQRHQGDDALELSNKESSDQAEEAVEEDPMTPKPSIDAAGHLDLSI